MIWHNSKCWVAASVLWQVFGSARSWNLSDVNLSTRYMTSIDHGYGRLALQSQRSRGGDIVQPKNDRLCRDSEDSAVYQCRYSFSFGRKNYRNTTDDVFWRCLEVPKTVNFLFIKFFSIWFQTVFWRYLKIKKTNK